LESDQRPHGGYGMSGMFAVKGGRYRFEKMGPLDQYLIPGRLTAGSGKPNIL